MSKPRLLVLLIGLNDYAAPEDDVAPLEGCVTDVQRFERFLKQPYNLGKFNWDPISDIKVLLNEEATKANIVAGLRDHLGQAQKDDVVLLYFSGHGFREKTTIREFKEDEFDGHLASLVCYDTNPHKNTRNNFTGLSDKELRYWIRQLAHDENGGDKARVVGIFDCCHSGQNTRSIAPDKVATNSASRLVQRFPFKARKEDAFDFGKDTRSIFNMLGKSDPLSLANILPEGRHIQLAACREIELAQEIENVDENGRIRGRKGAFTAALLDVLEQTEGNVSYDELYNRAKNLVPGYVKEVNPQSPQIYFPAAFSRLRYKTFLTHDDGTQSLQCGVVYDEQRFKWRITAGALRGIELPREVNGEMVSNTVVDIFEQGKAESIGQARVMEVFPDFSFIEEPKAGLDQTKKAAYYGEIKGLGINPIKLFATAKAGGEDIAKKLAANLTKLNEGASETFYEIVDNRAAADYVMTIADGKLFTSKADDPKDNPLFLHYDIKQVDDDRLITIAKAYSKILKQVATYNFLKKLEHVEEGNIPEGLNMYPVELKAYMLDEQEDGTIYEKPVNFSNGKISFDLVRDQESQLYEKQKKSFFSFFRSSKPEPINKVWKTLYPYERWIRFEMVNHTTGNRAQDFYCSLAVMDPLFGIHIKDMFFNQAQVLLGSQNKTIPSRGRRKIPLQDGTKFEPEKKRYARVGHIIKEDDSGHDKYVVDFNLPYTSNIFKFIVSKFPFDVTKLEMDALPPPNPSGKGIPIKRSTKGSFSFEDEEDEPKSILWEMHTFELVIQNADYDPSKD